MIIKKISCRFQMTVCQYCFILFQVHSSGALVISAMLDFLTFSLCSPYSETTDSDHFDNLLETVACNGRIVFKLFQVCRNFRMCRICFDCKVVCIFNLGGGILEGQGQTNSHLFFYQTVTCKLYD